MSEPLKRPQSQRERREMMPWTSAFCEQAYREFGAELQFRAVENGYVHSYQWGDEDD